MNAFDAKAKLSQVLAELKKEYLVKFPQKLEVLRALTEKQDWHALEQEYHKLKGTGKTYGFPEVSIVCQKLEDLAQDLESIDASLFQQALTLLEKIYHAYLHEQPFELEQDSFARSLLALKVK